MSRTKQIQTRPDLPSLEEITSDLESAPSDDVAFTFLCNYTSGTKEMSQNGNQDALKDTPKNFESAAKRPRQEAVKVTSRSGKSQAGGELVRTLSKEDSEVQECYLKVQKFLEMNSYLRDSQDKLTQQCSDLQELGQSVKDQIESLRTQLHT